MTGAQSLRGSILVTAVAATIAVGFAAYAQPADKAPAASTPAKQPVATPPAAPPVEAGKPSADKPAAEKLEYVKLTTSMGDIVLELDREHAPISVENFLSYVSKGFYDGTIFHRVMDGFQRDHELNRGAIRVRDDAAIFVLGNGVRIDLGHDQRNVVFVTKFRGVIDDHAPRSSRQRCIVAGHFGARREQPDIRLAEIEALDVPAVNRTTFE